MHVDDFLHAGDEIFEDDIIKKILMRFKAGKMEAKNFKYVGFEVDQNDIEIKISQDKYVCRIDHFT